MEVSRHTSVPDTQRISGEDGRPRITPPWVTTWGTENTVAERDQQLWVGIDIGKCAHHAAAVDAAGNLVWSHRVANDQESTERIMELATSADAV